MKKSKKTGFKEFSTTVREILSTINPKNMDDEQKARFWADRISRAKAEREEQTAKNWDRVTRYLLGDQWYDKLADRQRLTHSVVINMLWHIIRLYLPSLYLDDPYILVNILPDKASREPLISEEMERQEEWFQAKLNSFYTSNRVKVQYRRCIHDVLAYGYGISKTGWISTFNLKNENFEDITSRHKDRLIRPGPFISRVSPRDWLPDPDAVFFGDIRWCAERIAKPYYDFLRDEKYKNREKVIPVQFPRKISSEAERNQRARSELDKASVLSGLTSESSQFLMDSFVIIWEIWSLEENRIFAIAEGNEGILLRDDEMPYRGVLRGLPYHILSFNEVPDILFPPSDLEMIIPSQEHLNWIRSYQLSHIRKMIGIGFFDKNRLSSEELDKIENAVDGSLIGIDGEPANLFHRMEPLAIPGDHYAIQQVTKDEMWEIGGISQAARNVLMKGETATSQVQRENYSDLRMMDRVRQVVDFIVENTYDIAQYLVNFSSEISSPAIVEKLGKKQVLFGSFKDFPKNFSIHLEPVNTFPINRQIQNNQLLQLVNLIGNSPFVDQRELAIRLFENFQIKRIDKLVPSSVIPAEVIMLLNSMPQLVQQLQAYAIQLFNPDARRKVLDQNAPGNIPIEAGPLSRMQGG